MAASRDAFSVRRLVALAALAATALVTVAFSPADALMLAPALLLFGLLVNGFMPGERLIERLRERRGTRARDPRPSLDVPAPQRPVLVLRTGRALSFALAMRPPPAAPAFVSAA